MSCPSAVHLLGPFDWTGSSEARSRPGRVCCKVMRGQQCHNTHKVNKLDNTNIRNKYTDVHLSLLFGYIYVYVYV